MGQLGDIDSNVMQLPIPQLRVLPVTPLRFAEPRGQARGEQPALTRVTTSLLFCGKDFRPIVTGQQALYENRLTSIVGRHRGA